MTGPRGRTGGGTGGSTGGTTGGTSGEVMVDIFIPFWGEPSYLYAAVRSVLAQNRPGWRLTVIDDAYPHDVSGFFSGIGDERVRYLRNETNLGIIGNFRRCQELAEGTYTVFMGCDDLLLPDYVEVVGSVAAARPGVEIIQPGVQVIDAHGAPHLPLSDRVKAWLRPSTSSTARGRRGSGAGGAGGPDGPGAASGGPASLAAGGLRVLAGEDLARGLLVGDWLYWPSLAFRTSALKQAEFLDEYEIILDVGLIMDLIVDGARLAVADPVCFQYRRHSGSLSSLALLEGPRFADERDFFARQARRMEEIGWKRAARAARGHLMSRAYALSLLPSALRHRRGARALVTHALAR